MIAVGFLYDFWLCLIGIFVLLGASAEVQAVRHPAPRDHTVAPRDHTVAPQDRDFLR
jgi:hypothetical protein